MHDLRAGSNVDVGSFKGVICESIVSTNESDAKHVNLGNGFGKRWASNIFGASLLGLVCFWIYGRTLHYELIFDDTLSITKNESIKQLLPLFGTEDKFGPLRPSPDTPLQVRPLVNLTFALNYYFGKEEPWGYRLVNVIEHAIVAMILWSVLSYTLCQPVFLGRFASSSKMLAFWGALIWMVHPTHQDTVVYITQRTDLQMGLFYIIAIQISIWYWQYSRTWPKILLCIAASVASASGMLCKEMAASAPAMIALYEWTFVGGSLWGMWKRSWPLYLGLALSWLPITWLYANGLGTPLGGFNNVISAYDYWLTQSNSFFYYWRLVFYPWPLILHHHVPTLHSLAEAWPGVLAITIYGVVTTFLVWKRTVTGFVLLWFFAILSPTLIVPLPHEEIAERRMYVTLFAPLPALTIFLMQHVPLLFGGLAHHHASSTGRSLGVKSLALTYLPTIVILSALTAVTVSSVPRLERKADLWTYVLRHQPDNHFALASQGMEELRKGEVELGIEKLQRAYRSEPNYTFLAHSLIQALDYLQQYPRMLEVCVEQSKIHPGDPITIFNLAAALEKNGQNLQAIEEYQKYVDLQPKSWKAQSSLATLLAESGRPEEAIHHFELASEIQPDFMNYANLLTLYLQAGLSEKIIQIIPLVLKASREEHSPEEHERVELQLKKMESQIRNHPTLRATL